MENKIKYTTELVKWKSDAGINMQRWDVYKGILLVGRIYPSDYKAKFSVMLEKSFKTRYVQKFETALSHIKRKTKNIYSLSDAIGKIYN